MKKRDFCMAAGVAFVMFCTTVMVGAGLFVNGIKNLED